MKMRKRRHPGNGILRHVLLLLVSALVLPNGGCKDDSSGPGPGPSQAPRLSVSPATLTFNVQQGSGAATQALSIRNGGQGSLTYSCQAGSAWLTLTDGSGTAPGTVTVGVDAQGLEVGTHGASITVTSPEADNSPVTVQVTLQISAAPEPWITLALTDADPIDAGAIASDGQRLIAYYATHWGQLNSGYIKEWTGTAWSRLVSTTNQCHEPDVTVDGTGIASVCYDDNHDYVFYSNVKGYWSGDQGPWLRDQFGMTVTFAMGRPYMVWAGAYVGGIVSDYTRLHLNSPQPSGVHLALAGYSGRMNRVSIGKGPAITGDAGALYVGFTQGGELYVDRGTMAGGFQALGGNIARGGGPEDPEMAMFGAQPVVAWFEAARMNVYIARWNGGSWNMIGQATLDATSDDLRIAADGTNLYVVYAYRNLDIVVNRFDGTAWVVLGAPSGTPPLPDSYIISADIAVWHGQPVVSFTRDGDMTVRSYTGTGRRIQALPEQGGGMDARGIRP